MAFLDRREKSDSSQRSSFFTAIAKSPKSSFWHFNLYFSEFSSKHILKKCLNIFTFFVENPNYQHDRWDLCDSIAFSWGLICALVRYFSMIFVVKTRFGAPFFQVSRVILNLGKSLQTWLFCLLSEGRFSTKKTVLKALSTKKMSRNTRGVGGFSPFIASI